MHGFASFLSAGQANNPSSSSLSSKHYIHIYSRSSSPKQATYDDIASNNLSVPVMAAAYKQRQRAVAAALLFLLVAHGSCSTKHKSGNKQHKAHAAPIPPAPAPPMPNNNGSSGDGWLNARATWYGAPNGAGPDDNGGACGFKDVNMPPFSAMTSCGNEPLFEDGKGCGSCYQIRCLAHPACSGVPETVIITDMSGTAFGAMARDGRNDELRHAGIVDIQFKRVPCQYAGLTVTFHIERGSNPNYLAVLVEYSAGDGDVVPVDLMESRAEDGEPTGVWEPMRESWGSIWRMDTRRPLQGPFSLRVTNESGRTLVADQVIPADWQPDSVYSSIVQFD